MVNVLKEIDLRLHSLASLCAAAHQLPEFPPLVTWVDDFAIPRCGWLGSLVVQVLEAVRTVMRSYGLQLNMQARETELVCQCHGVGAASDLVVTMIHRASWPACPSFR